MSFLRRCNDLECTVEQLDGRGFVQLSQGTLGRRPAFGLCYKLDERDVFWVVYVGSTFGMELLIPAPMHISVLVARRNGPRSYPPAQPFPCMRGAVDRNIRTSLDWPSNRSHTLIWDYHPSPIRTNSYCIRCILGCISSSHLASSCLVFCACTCATEDACRSGLYLERRVSPEIPLRCNVTILG